MKRLLAASLFILLAALPVRTEPQDGVVITITAGTAQRFVTRRTMASSMLIQPLPGSSTAAVYVLNAQPTVTCANAGAGTTFVAQLNPATASQTGSTFVFPTNGTATAEAGGFDVQYWCLDGAHSGDQVAISWDARN